MKTTIFTSADKYYEPFVLPYITSALIHNEDAQVEICLEDPSGFTTKHKDVLNKLDESFPGRFLLRPGDFSVPPGNVRFLETPELVSEYTYIGDIDILILENITGLHLKNMKKTGLPYSNILRPDGKSLTGLHFTKTGEYYPLAEIQDKSIRDEDMLYEMIILRGLPLPGEEDKFRPMHGFHLSLSRPPSSKTAPDWGIGGGGYENYIEKYTQLRTDPIWVEVLIQMSLGYKMLLMMLDYSISAVSEHDLKPSGTYSLRQLFKRMS